MLQEIIVLTVAYIVLIGLFQPSKKKTVAPIAVAPQPMEEVTEEVPQVEEPEIVSEPVYKAIATTALCPMTVATAPAQPVQGFTPDLSKMGVRQLYRIASSAGLKNYKKLSRAQLIEALA